MSLKQKMKPSIWTSMYAELPLHEAITFLHGCGWRVFEISTEHLVGIETSRYPDRLINKAMNALSKHGLSAPQAHAYLQARVTDPDARRRKQDIKRLLRHIDIAARLKVKNIVVHPGGCKKAGAAERRRVRKLNVEAFRRLGDRAGERGMRIGLENLLSIGTTTSGEMLDLIGEIDHPAMGVILDTSHANANGQDAAQLARDLAPYLVGTHISDNNGSGDQHLAPGGGTIDWISFMRALRDIKYDGIFNLEIPGERHPVPGIKRLKARFANDVAKWLVA